MSGENPKHEMSEEVSHVFAQLWNQPTELHHRWQEYETLFASGKGRIDILNENCGALFGLVQQALWSETLLQICRITDPPKSAGKENLTCRRIPDLVRQEFRDEITEALTKVEESVGFARDWRNRVLAHADLDLTLAQPAKPLTPVQHEMVTKALAAIGDFLNTIDLLYNDRTTCWKPIRPLTGSETLLYVLRAGNRAKNDDIEAMSSGDYDWTSGDRYMAPLPS